MADLQVGHAKSAGYIYVDIGAQPSTKWHDVNVVKVSNGFIITVGCKKFVAKTWDEAAKGLREYWADPVAAEKKFCAAQ